jgi:hypothetical protein
VTHAGKPYEAALGTRVVKIGDMPIKEVQDRLVQTALSACECKNQWYVLNTAPARMTRPEVLHALGIVPDLARVPFTFEDDAGQQFTLELEPVSAKVDAKRRVSLKLTPAVKNEPLYRQRPGEGFWYTYLEESKTVYVCFRAYPKCSVPIGCPEFDKLMKFVDEHRPERLVIDLRQNGGGDSSTVRRSLLPAIKKREAINRKGHLYVITGRRTFPAALWNAVDFKKGTNATIVGEPPGERPNSYSENDEMTLPNSRIVVSYSTRYYQFLDEDVPAFLPDKRIDPDWQSFKAGRDPVMEWILSDAAGS